MDQCLLSDNESSHIYYCNQSPHMAASGGRGHRLVLLTAFSSLVFIENLTFELVNPLECQMRKCNNGSKLINALHDKAVSLWARPRRMSYVWTHSFNSTCYGQQAFKGNAEAKLCIVPYWLKCKFAAGVPSYTKERKGSFSDTYPEWIRLIIRGSV